ncbi:unnamed protein product [Ambrosiozyma monospora]|uniref:Unnamed protein product n=1 Tax=Ambrosiozyma monospora TaxID=43982 RepID=A0ACB5T525_AMBMO|nr:unnamed protein product [Ambrosiozyma monospora]
MSFPPTLSDYPEFGTEMKNEMDLENLQKSDLSMERSKTGSSGTRNGAYSGLLLGRLFEHSTSVNCIVASPDHRFFITGDEFGSIRLWETSKFESNATGSSIASINLGSAITSITFMPKRYCFAVATKGGCIKIFRLSVQGKPNNSTIRHSTVDLTLLRNYQVDEFDSYALSIQFSISDEKPMLAFTTPTCKLILLDIRTMEIVSTLQNNLSYGIPGCFAVDNKQSWVVIGTSKGILCLWDLSFELMLKAVKFKKTLYPIKSVKLIQGNYEVNKKKNVFVAVIGGSGESDVTVWDVSKLQPRNVLCTSSVTSTIEIYSVKDLHADPDLIDEDFMQLSLNVDWILKNKSSTALTTSIGPDGHPYLVSATPLGKIIKWNLVNPDKSQLIIGGLNNPNVQDTPVFSSTQINANLSFINERYTSNSETANGGNSFRRKAITEQQEVLKNHTDVVNDLIVLRRPFEMVVSVDRSGVINVYKS